MTKKQKNRLRNRKRNKRRKRRLKYIRKKLKNDISDITNKILKIDIDPLENILEKLSIKI
jgi:hypothetical protein